MYEIVQGNHEPVAVISKLGWLLSVVIDMIAVISHTHVICMYTILLIHYNMKMMNSYIHM